MAAPRPTSHPTTLGRGATNTGTDNLPVHAAVAPTGPSMTAEQEFANVIGDTGLDMNAPVGIGDHPGQTLAQWAWGLHVSGVDDATIARQIYQTKPFQTAYPAYDQLKQTGVVSSASQYRSVAAQYRANMEQAGVDPKKYGTNDQIAQLMLGDVSPSEVSARLQVYQSAVNNVSPEAKAYLAQHYGLTNSDLMDIWLNPKDTLPDLESKVAASNIGGVAARSGWGDLNVESATALANLGVTQQQAESGFGQLAGMRELTADVGGTGSVSRDQELNAVLGGDAETQQKLQRIQAARVAAFQGGGQLAQNQSGIVGLRSANTQ
jgi:hypothetical protein